MLRQSLRTDAGCHSEVSGRTVVTLPRPGWWGIATIYMDHWVSATVPSVVVTCTLTIMALLLALLGAAMRRHGDHKRYATQCLRIC